MLVGWTGQRSATEHKSLQILVRKPVARLRPKNHFATLPKTPIRPDAPENHLSNHPKTKTADRAETQTTPKTNHNFQAEIKVLRQVPPDR